MVATEPTEDVLDVALSMIDTRAWGARLRVVSIIRVLQRRSPDGVARIGHKELCRRAGLSESSWYGWQLFGTSDRADGLMWRVEHILELVEVGTGRRPTGWRLRPVDRWRGVPWLEETREIRRLALADARRAPDRDTNDGPASRPLGATQTSVASRSLGARLDPLASRSRARRNDVDSVAVNGRDANPFDRGPSSSYQREAEASLHHEDEDDGSYAAKAKAAMYAKGKPVWGKPLRRLASYEGTTPIEVLIEAIMAAPSDNNISAYAIAFEWVPMYLKHGARSNGAAPVDPEVDRIQRELAKVERQIHAERLAGEEPPPYLVADRDRWQNELDQLTGAKR